MSTTLVYLEDFKRFACDARVVAVSKENDRDVVVLDQTVFYPQGGGQPCDRGVITSDESSFAVTEVRLVDGVVKHFGTFTGAPFAEGQSVTCSIDQVRRVLNSRIHSAGHLIDKAMSSLKISLMPGKAFHFSDGPYVEYIGSLVGVDKDALKTDLERICNAWIQEGLEVRSIAMKKDQLASCCHFVPEHIPEGKPVYVVFFGEFCGPCGGTHVGNISEIDAITIRKIKESNDTVRVSYDVIRGN